ncbi:copper transporter [Brevibacterium album]|uniref:copper transporter n=1 Tax=Brevibacterium album TaxID=417948 RepID=UPI00041730DB|nr:copper transporter [Brevibacterium album]
MIDFRYHLVSLISVFLALAVGIVLGAGPLQEPIGTSLQGQVDALRTDRDNLRAELDHARNDAAQLSAFIDASAGELTEDALSGTSVALVRLAGADAPAGDAVAESIGTAGGTVASDVALSDTAFDAGDAELLAALREADASLPADDAEAVRVAVVRALAPAEGEEGAGSETQPTEGAEEGEGTEAPRSSGVDEQTAEALFSVLADAGRFTSGERAAADAVVVIAPADPAEAEGPAADGTEATDSAEEAAPTDEAGDAGADAPTEADIAAAAAFSRELGDSADAVIAGSRASAVQGLIAELRSEGEGLTTVDSLDLAAGPVLVPLAVRAADAGTRGHYGTTQSADSVLPEAS